MKHVGIVLSGHEAIINEFLDQMVKLRAFEVPASHKHWMSDCCLHAVISFKTDVTIGDVEEIFSHIDKISLTSPHNAHCKIGACGN